MNRANIFVLSTAFMCCSFITLGGMAQSNVTQSQDIPSLRNAFEDILVGTDKAGGSVIVNKTCSPETQAIRTKQQPGSKEDPFDFLIRTSSGYRVINNSESVNLLPADYEPEILRTHINYFVIDSDKSAEAILYELLESEELKPQVDAIQLNKGNSMQVSIGISPPPMPAPRKFKSISNKTLREALNEIAVFYRNGIWAYRENRCDGKVRSSLSFTKG